MTYISIFGKHALFMTNDSYTLADFANWDVRAPWHCMSGELSGDATDMSTIVKGKLVSETSAYLLTRGTS